MSNSKIASTQLRQNLSDILNRAAYGRERVLIHRGKKRFVAIVPVEDYDFLEQLEDRIDIAAARKALKDPRTIPWETIKKKLKL
jgi:prevent-host-death family protein